MEILFSNLKRKEVKCVIFEEKGILRIAYENIDIIKEKYDGVIEVYSPNEKQRKLILDIIGSNLEITENKVNAKISDEDLLLVLVEELTNIKLDLDREKDKDKIQEILSDPTELLLRVKMEINKICNEIFYMWYDATKEFSRTPDELKEAILLNNQEVKAIPSEKDLKKAELLKQLKELEKEE